MNIGRFEEWELYFNIGLDLASGSLQSQQSCDTKGSVNLNLESVVRGIFRQNNWSLPIPCDQIEFLQWSRRRSQNWNDPPAAQRSLRCSLMERMNVLRRIPQSRKRTWNREIDLTILDPRLFKNFGELSTDVTIVSYIRWKKKSQESGKETYVVAGLTEYLSTMRRYWRMKWIDRLWMTDKKHTETNGSPSKGTRKAANALEHVFNPPLQTQ